MFFHIKVSVLLHANVFVKENSQALIKQFYLRLRRVRSPFDREEDEGAKFLCGKAGCLLRKKIGLSGT